MEIKDKIKLFRKSEGLTQQEFAKLLGISRSYLEDIEHGRIKGSIKLMNKLADVTNKSLSYWATDANIEIHQYDGLDTLINIMIDNNIIKENVELSEETELMLMGMLKKEIALKFERIRKD